MAANATAVLQKVLSFARQIQTKDVTWEFNGKWLRAGTLRYTDPNGKEKCWETVERTTRTGDVDSVDMIATVPAEKCVILVAVYRPPVHKISIEFPSGLIEKGERPEVAAVREMKEETGQTSKCEAVGIATYIDPWKSNENSLICQMSLTDTSETTQLHLDEDEILEPIQLPLNNLLESLEMLHKTYDVIIDSRLYTFAIGLHMGRNH